MVHSIHLFYLHFLFFTLLIFSILFNIYQYVNATRANEDLQGNLTSLNNKVSQQKLELEKPTAPHISCLISQYDVEDRVNHKSSSSLKNTALSQFDRLCLLAGDIVGQIVKNKNQSSSQHNTDNNLLH